MGSALMRLKMIYHQDRSRKKNHWTNLVCRIRKPIHKVYFQTPPKGSSSDDLFLAKQSLSLFVWMAREYFTVAFRTYVPTLGTAVPGIILHLQLIMKSELSDSPRQASCAYPLGAETWGISGDCASKGWEPKLGRAKSTLTFKTTLRFPLAN